jgi:agmatinase
VEYFVEDGYGSFGGLAFPTVALKDANVIIQGVPYESASSGKKGASKAPDALRMISKDMQTISRRGIDVNDMVLLDMGNIPINHVEGKATRTNISQSMTYLLEEGNSPIISIGGDHSVAFPLIKSTADMDNVGIIWFDAHRDLLNEIAGSKYGHGCPLRRLIELENIDPGNVLLVGTRYMEPEEQEVIEKQGINEITMVGLEEASNKRKLVIDKINEIASRVGSLYVSVDIDVLDPAYAPGTGTPVGGGMSTSELMTYISEIPASVRAFDLVEISPPLDLSGITIKTGMGIITEMLAQIKKNM